MIDSHWFISVLGVYNMILQLDFIISEILKNSKELMTENY